MFWALVALTLLYRILCLLTRSKQFPTGHWPLSLLLTIFYAVTYFFWYYATTTEQYSSAIAQTLAIVYIYLRWSTLQSETIGIVPLFHPANRLLIILAFLCGLSLAHMLTVAFIVPPLVTVILWQAPQLLRHLRLVVVTIIAAFLPLISYSYVYLRGSAHPEWWGSGQWATPEEWFWTFVSTAQGRSELSWGFEEWCTTFANGMPALIGRELTWPIVVLGLIGIALLSRYWATLCYGTLVLYLVFAWFYRCGNWFQVILPAYPLLIIGLAVLVSTMLRHHSENATAMRKQIRWQWVLWIILLVAVVSRAWLIWPSVDNRNRLDDDAFDQAAILLAQPLPTNARLFATVDDALALQYLGQIWRLRSDLQVISSPEAAAWLKRGGAVYSTWNAAPTLRSELPDTLSIAQAATNPYWVCLQSSLTNEPIMQGTTSETHLLAEQVIETKVAPGITLDSYQVMSASPTPLAAYRAAIADAARGLDLMLLWEVYTENWPVELAISVRLTKDGEVIPGAQIDRPYPANGLSDLQQRFIADPYHFSLSDEQPSAINGALIILYRQTERGFENIGVTTLTWAE